MTNKEKYSNVFAEMLEVDASQVENLEYHGIDTWDSVGQMSLISELEDVFDIMFDTDDIIDFSSYKKGIEIMKKYDIVIE